MNLKKYINFFILISIFLLFVLNYHSTWVWMYQKWTAADSYSSHGFLIPLISIWLIYQKKDKIKNVQFQGNWLGLAFLLFGLLLHCFSGISRVHFTSGISTIITFSGILILFFGMNFLREIWFPVLYLFLMLPFPSIWDIKITLTLKLLATEAATIMLDLFGYIGLRVGSFIYFSEGQKLLVGDVCSGLRSLLSLIALGLPFVYLIKESWWKKGIMLLCLFPVSFVFNTLRIVLLGIITYHWGSEKAAHPIIHDGSGFLLFAGDLITLWVIYVLLQDKKKNIEVNKDIVKESSLKKEKGILDSLVEAIKIAYQSFLQLPISQIFWKKYIIAMCLLSITCWISFQYLYQDFIIENKSYTQAIPTKFGEWEIALDFPINERTIQVLETSDILMRYYRRSNNELPVLLSVVASASSNRKIAHPPEICYNGMGWEIMRHEKIVLSPGFDVILLVVYNGRSQELVIYWYKFEDKFTSDYYSHQANALFNFFHKHKGGLALIRTSIVMPDGDIEKNLKILTKFATDILPILKEKLP